MSKPVDPGKVALELRKVVEAVERGDLDASTPRDRRMLAQIQGAIVALEELGRTAKDS
jgi:hypothetical protein